MGNPGLDDPNDRPAEQKVAMERGQWLPGEPWPPEPIESGYNEMPGVHHLDSPDFPKKPNYRISLKDSFVSIRNLHIIP